MSSSLLDDDSIEMPDDFEHPQDISVVGKWMNVWNISVPPPPPPPKSPDVQNDVNNDVVPPPPPPMMAADRIGDLEADMARLEEQVQKLTTDLLRCAKECDLAPLDKSSFDQLLKAHAAAIEKRLKYVQSQMAAIPKTIKEIMTCPDASQVKPRLKAVHESYKEIEYDFQVDQYNACKSDAVDRINKAYEISKQVIANITAVEKELLELETQSRNGLPVESWDPTGQRNKYAALATKTNVVLQSLTNAMSKEAHNAAKGLQETARQVYASLSEELTKQIDFGAKAKEIAEECRKIILASDDDNFPLMNWAPSGKPRQSLDARVAAIHRQLSGIGMPDEISTSLAVYNDLCKAIAEKMKDGLEKQSAEIFWAPIIAQTVNQISPLEVQMNDIGGAAQKFAVQADAVIRGVNVETNAQRAEAWNSLDSSFMNDWQLAKQQMDQLRYQMQNARSALPWLPDNLVNANKIFDAAEKMFTDIAKAVAKSQTIYEKHNNEITNFSNDVDLASLITMGQDAEILSNEFDRVGQMALTFRNDAYKIIQMQAGEEQRNAWLQLKLDWRPGPGSRWDDHLDSLEELEKKLAEAGQAISWQSLGIVEAKARIDDCRWHFQYNKKTVDEAVQLYDDNNGIMLGQDEEVIDDDENDPNETINEGGTPDGLGNQTQGNDEDDDGLIIEDDPNNLAEGLLDDPNDQKIETKGGDVPDPDLYASLEPEEEKLLAEISNKLDKLAENIREEFDDIQDVLNQ